MSKRCLFATAALLTLAACASDHGPEDMSDKVTVPANLPPTTVPIIVENDQILIPLEAVGPGGKTRKFLANMNMGGPYSGWQNHIYEEIGFVPKTEVKFKLGDIPITIAPGASYRTDDIAYPGRQSGFFFFTHPVEGQLQCGVFEQFDIALDYVDKTLTLGAPGTLPHEGVAVPIKVNDKTGMISVDFMVDGKAYPMVIDNGGPYTWVRPHTAEEWLKAHPDWERGKGAVSLTNYGMTEFDVEQGGRVMRLPRASLGPMEIDNVGIFGTGSRIGAMGFGSTEDFFDEWQKNAPEPVVAWLGGNVLKHYRLTIDYKKRMSWWLKKSEFDAHELDQVGVNLTYDDKGHYSIGGIVTQNGKPTASGVEQGDRITAIDDTKVEGWSRDQIFAALHGKPGDIHRVTVERSGKSLTVPLPVTAF